MRSKIGPGLTLLPAAAMALGLWALPGGPAHALGHDTLRAAVGQALGIPDGLVAQASETMGQPQMMVQNDMMDGTAIPGMMRGMMGMMQMMGRMGEMMGDEEMTDEKREMMETCNRMMQAMIDDGAAQQPARVEPQDAPRQ